MSITAADSTRETFDTNGSTKIFTYPHPFLAKSDIVVQRQIDVTGVISTLVLDVDYTLTATNNDYSSGGTITTTAAAAYVTGSTLVVTRSIPLSQGTTWNDGEAFPANTTEAAMDKLTMLMQQVQTKLDRCVQVASGDVLPGTVTNAIDRAEKFLKWDASGVISAAAATGTVTNTIGDNIYYTSDYGDMSSVITAVGAVNSTVYLDSNIDGAGDTIPSTVYVIPMRGGQFTGTGALTINGPVKKVSFEIYASTLTVTGTFGAESLTTAAPAATVFGVSLIDSTSNAVDTTLGSAFAYGDIKTFIMTEASNSSTVSVTNHETSDPEVITFAAVDDTAVLMWTGTEWITIKLSGATV